MTAPQRLRVVSVGRQVPKKGFDVLLRAVAELRDRGIDLDVVLVGEAGDATPEIERLVEELGLDDLVETRGPCSQAGLLRLYRGATLFALACRVADDGDRDGIPNVLVESMAAGLPVVATAVSGIPELVRTARTACWCHRRIPPPWPRRSPASARTPRCGTASPAGDR